MLLLFFIGIILLVLIDQLTKLLVINTIKGVETLPLIQDVFHLTYWENRGAAFGILQNQRVFFVVLTILIVLAVVVFIAFNAIGIKEHHGLRYYKHWLQPFAFLLPLMLVEDFVKPVSLTFRLYGNVFGEETVTHELFQLFPVGLPVVMQFLSVLMGLIQALVFSLLAAIYIKEAMPEEEEHL